MKRFRELDGLRGIAAMIVVLYHFTLEHTTRYPADPAPIYDFRWGQYGVQLFFLISGFVILMSARAARKPSDFVISRVSRLYPAYWMSLAIAVGIATWAAIPEVPLGIRDILVNLTMVQRWFQVPSVVDAYWTLAVEMQFYVLLFVLMLVARNRLSDRLMISAAGAWLALCLAVAIWAFPMTHGIPPQHVTGPARLVVNASLAAYGPLFCTGMLAFLSRLRGKLHWMTLPAAAVAVLTTGLLQTWDDAAWIGVMCFAFLIAALREKTRMLTIAPLQWLGKISYSLYLTHRFVGYSLIHLLWPWLGRPGAMLVAVIAALLLGWVVYEIAERRLSRWLRIGLTRWRDGHQPANARNAS